MCFSHRAAPPFSTSDRSACAEAEALVGLPPSASPPEALDVPLAAAAPALTTGSSMGRQAFGQAPGLGPVAQRFIRGTMRLPSKHCDEGGGMWVAGERVS